MAVLKVIRGSTTGQHLEVQGERTVLGRHPNCQIVLDNAAVSRHHAQILESHGNFFLEDLRSRNGTQLNGESISGRVQLRDGDEVKLCDYVFEFLLTPSLGASGVRKTSTTSTATFRSRRIRDTIDTPGEFPQFSLSSVDFARPSGTHDSSILTTLEARATSGIRLNAQPEVKLRAILEIGNALGRMLKLDEVLPVVLDCLFKIFPSADTGFILLKDGESGQLEVRAALGRTEDVKGPPISQTIVKQAMEGGQAILSADARGDHRFETSESVASLQIRSVMCAPLLDQSGQALGVLQISTRDLEQQFTKDDLDLLASVSTQAALAIDNATLHETLLKRREMEQDLEFATQVQLGFLPNKSPEAKDYEFADYYEAAHRVGGDYFDYIRLPNGDLAIAIGDVAGKGVPAALLMVRLHAAARYHLLSTTSAAEALNHLNAEMATSGLGFRFVTLALAILTPATHTIRLANAGHLPPILRKANGEVSTIGLAESGMPLGILQGQEFQEISLTLEPDDTLLLYTDGITEAMNEKQEIYGRRRLQEFAEKSSGRCQELVSSLVAQVEKFCGDGPQRDDLCIVAFRRKSH